MVPHITTSPVHLATEQPASITKGATGGPYLLELFPQLLQLLGLLLRLLLPVAKLVFCC